MTGDSPQPGGDAGGGVGAMTVAEWQYRLVAELPPEAAAGRAPWPTLAVAGPVTAEELSSLPQVLLRPEEPGEARDHAADGGAPQPPSGDGREPGGSAQQPSTAYALALRAGPTLRAAGAWAAALLWGTALPPLPVGFRPDAPALDWHPARRWLAAAAGDDARQGVLLYALEGPPPQTPPQPVRLTADFLRGVGALAWRPPALAPRGAAGASGPLQLAAGCLAGVAVWTTDAAPAGGKAATTATPGPAALPPSNPKAWRALFLRRPHHRPVTALAWSPDGHWLASGSPGDRALVIWDVAAGAVAAAPRGGLMGVSLLRWSPGGGHYLLAAGPLKDFRLWEASSGSWAASQRWETPGAGRVRDAAWAPDGRAALLVMPSAGSASPLVALYLLGPPPGLAAQVLPVDVSEATRAEAPGMPPAEVAALAWGAGGTRLALLLAPGPHPRAGQVALFATRREPVITAHLIGFVQGPPPPPQPAVLLPGGAAGPPAAPARPCALSVAFADGGAAGPAPLLAVRWQGGSITLVPLLLG